MTWPVMRNSRPIGLDLGERTIKAVQLAPQGGRQKLIAAAGIERPGPGGPVTCAELRELRKRLASEGFRGANLALAVPGEKLLTGIMELPPADSGAPIEMLARSELARLHKCDPQSFEMTSWRLPAPARAANTTFVMGAACTHADADCLLDCFEAEGFRVDRLEVHSQALTRALAPLLGSGRGLAGVLDIGWTAPRLVLVYDGVVIYERKLAKSALGDWVCELAKRLGIETREAEAALFGQAEHKDHAQAASDACERYAANLAEEMKIPLSYVMNQYPDGTAEQLLLVGGGSRMSGLTDRLAEAMAWPVRTATLPELVDCSADLDPRLGATSVAAAGLAWAGEEG